MKANEAQIEFFLKHKINYSPDITEEEANNLINAFKRTFKMERKTKGMEYQMSLGPRVKEYQKRKR